MGRYRGGFDNTAGKEKRPSVSVVFTAHPTKRADLSVFVAIDGTIVVDTKLGGRGETSLPAHWWIGAEGRTERREIDAEMKKEKKRQMYVHVCVCVCVGRGRGKGKRLSEACRGKEKRGDKEKKGGGEFWVARYIALAYEKNRRVKTGGERNKISTTLSDACMIGRGGRLREE